MHENAGSRRYRCVSHTADLGIFVRSAELAGLFADASHALTDVMIRAERVRPAREETVRLEEPSVERLLVKWLSEHLYLFETRGFVAASAEVRLDGPRLEATLRGESFSPDRHDFKTEVKAVTYHRLQVQRTARGWRAFFILDL